VFLKKVVILVSSLFLVASATFFLMKAAPGDPFIQEQAVPEEIIKSLYAHYGLDKPIFFQYIKYLKGLITFNLGPSFRYEGRTVNDIISEGFPVSFILGLEGLIISLVFGVFFGTVAALNRGRWPDRLAMVFAVFGISFPNFIMATFLQYFFSMKLNLLPAARWGSFNHTILPALSIAALPTAFIARLVRSSTLEVLEQDYIQTARSKGLSIYRVIIKHILKNSFLPVISYIGPLTSGIITGSFVVEKIFGIPGLGGWFVSSISNRDYTVIMGVTMFYSSLLMLSTFLVDIIYSILDPRINFSQKKI